MEMKYGSSEKLEDHIALWAYKLSFFHPPQKKKKWNLFTFRWLSLSAYFNLKFEVQLLL